MMGMLAMADERRRNEGYRLSEREAGALQRGTGKAALVRWLRAEAAATDGPRAWFVARTRGRADLVAEELRAEGIEAVCPLRRVFKRFPRSVRGKSVDIPMFGNHVLVHLVRADSAFVGLMTFDGVDGLLGAGDRPVPLAAAEVARVLELLGKQADGEPPETPAFSPGDRVLHPLGSFAELHGVVVSIDPLRRYALVETVLFGRQMTTRCGIDDLERLE